MSTHKSHEAEKLDVTYKAIIGEIGNHLLERKKTLAKRVLFISWPWIIGIPGLIILTTLMMINTDNTSVIYLTLGLSVIMLVFALPWVLITTFLFAIEKRIWIDSYFDGKDLSPKESWKLSKKLFKPTIKLFLFIVKKYPLLLWPVLYTIIFVVLFKFQWFVYFLENNEELAGIFLVFVPFVLVSGIIYAIVILKLRFIYFVFLDHYGKRDFSFEEVLDETIRLNKVGGKEQLKKVLVTYVGVHSLGALVNMVNSALLNRLERIIGRSYAGKAIKDYVGKAVTAPIRIYTSMYIKEASSFAKIIAWYVIYKKALKISIGVEHRVNKNLYQLIDK